MNSRYIAFCTALFLFLPLQLNAGRIIWPCSGRVTSDYGPRESPCSGCSTFHHGIDIGVGTGTILGSPGNGTVTSYAFDSCGGNIMKIGYGGGWETRFLHTSSAIKGVGSAVTRNVDSARSGGTGSCTTGPHLHFEVRKDGVSQLVPGSVGTNVTRNTEVPRDYPGLNDAPAVINPPFNFDSNEQGWSVGNGLTGLTWTNCCSWPGIIYADQVGGDGFFYSPQTNFTGAANQLVHVRVFPQNGSSPQHDMKVYWKTAASNVWDEAKSSNLVGYTKQNDWYDVYMGLNSSWTGQNIIQMRLDVDMNNQGNRWILDKVEVVNINQPPWTFDTDTEGWGVSNSITGFTWTNCCGWTGIIYGDQSGGDASFISPLAYFGGGAGDWIKVRVFPQGGTTANHDMQIFWSHTGDPYMSASKSSSMVTYVAQDTWAEVYLQVGNNADWNGKTITQVRLDFDQGNSATRWIVDSVQISGPPPTPPSAPSGLTATAVSGSQINLTWTDNSNNETNFVVARSSTNGGPYTNIATVGANVTSYNSTGLSASTTYYYVVRATNQGGNSSDSGQASATTLQSPPAAPSALSAVAQGNTQINLTWTDNSSDESNFIVARGSASGGPYSDIATLSANTTTYSNTGLAAGTTYYYVVRATNAGGASANSAQASATTVPNIPNAPSGLSASGVNTTQVNLSWTDASSNESNFVVARSATAGGPYTDIATLGANTTSYSNTGLAANTTYYYVVRATNAAGGSANSNEAAGVTWPNEIVIDNSDAGFAASANWAAGTSSADKFGADYRFRSTAAISDLAVWTINVPQSRNYEIYAWWTQGTNRAVAATYTLPDNAAVAVNQQAGGGAWNSLGTKSLGAGTATVKLSCWTTTGFVVVADAVRVVLDSVTR